MDQACRSCGLCSRGVHRPVGPVPLGSRSGTAATSYARAPPCSSRPNEADVPSVIFSVISTLVPFGNIVANISQAASELRAGSGQGPPMPDAGPKGGGGTEGGLSGTRYCGAPAQPDGPARALQVVMPPQRRPRQAERPAYPPERPLCCRLRRKRSGDLAALGVLCRLLAAPARRCACRTQADRLPSCPSSRRPMAPASSCVRRSRAAHAQRCCSS